MQFLDFKIFNDRAENIFLRELPETTVLTGEGFSISSTELCNSGSPIKLNPEEGLVCLKRYKSQPLLFNKKGLNITDLESMVDFLTGQLCYDIFLYKLSQEQSSGHKLKLTRTNPKIVISDSENNKLARLYIEVLIATERR